MIRITTTTINSPLDEQRRIVAYLDGLPPSLCFGDLRQAKVNAVREVQSVSGDELRRSRTLMPSVLDRAFKGEL
ncbi:MAG: hypothetical protein C3F07_19210 [Anaerolineales bacterium]|nr:MAG: hypothetical protein C3F07_19210 [Anaerolineales bacterium]